VRRQGDIRTSNIPAHFPALRTGTVRGPVEACIFKRHNARPAGAAGDYDSAG
jgi:hypothetical protein